MKELNLQQLENLEGGKRPMFGWTDSGPRNTFEDLDCPSGVGYTQTQYFAVFWLETSHREVIGCMPNW